MASIDPSIRLCSLNPTHAHTYTLTKHGFNFVELVMCVCFNFKAIHVRQLSKWNENGLLSNSMSLLCSVLVVVLSSVVVVSFPRRWSMEWMNGAGRTRTKRQLESERWMEKDVLASHCYSMDFCVNPSLLSSLWCISVLFKPENGKRSWQGHKELHDVNI